MAEDSRMSVMKPINFGKDYEPEKNRALEGNVRRLYVSMRRVEQLLMGGQPNQVLTKRTVKDFEGNWTDAAAAGEGPPGPQGDPGAQGEPGEFEGTYDDLEGTPPYYLLQEVASKSWLASEFKRGDNIIGVRQAGATVLLPHDLEVEKIITVKDEVGGGFTLGLY